MKQHIWKVFIMLATVLSWTACGGSDDKEIVPASKIALVSVTPANGATDIATGVIDVTIQYSANVSFASSSASSITVTGGELVSAKVPGISTQFIITVKVPTAGTKCTISYPEGLVLGPNKAKAQAFSTSFMTKEAKIQLVTANASAQATNLYKYLNEIKGSKVLSGMMAQIDWNTQESERVNKLIGKCPAINGFDYIHMPYAGSNWAANYLDISPVKNWWDQGGIVTIGWHWLVPVSEGATDYTFGTDSKFVAANALIDGTWENKVWKTDLSTCAQYLAALRDAQIPVLWRPFHEAAGAWFWWGKDKDAATYVKLWRAMFDYFKQQGLNNLIWVWTSQVDDPTWYPGDDYVDIVGCDIYGDNAASCNTKYSTLTKDYGSSKLITLSECGYTTYGNKRIAQISEQWNAGCRWLWFMPWYDTENDANPHADDAWWKDAASQSYVLWREDVPSLK